MQAPRRTPCAGARRSAWCIRLFGVFRLIVPPSFYPWSLREVRGDGHACLDSDWFDSAAAVQPWKSSDPETVQAEWSSTPPHPGRTPDGTRAGRPGCRSFRDRDRGASDRPSHRRFDPAHAGGCPGKETEDGSRRCGRLRGEGRTACRLRGCWFACSSSVR